MPKQRNNTIAKLIALLAGIAVAIPFNHQAWWVTWVAIGMLYSLLRGRPIQQRIQMVALFGLGFFATLLSWMQALGFDVFVLLTVLCLSLCLILALVPIPTSVIGGPVAFASTWVLVEFLRSHFPFGGFPWGMLGYSQVDGPVIGFARVGGTAAVAFGLCLVIALAVEAVATKFAFVLVGSLALVATASLVPTMDSGETVRVAAVQGSVPVTGRNDFNQRQKVLERHVQQTLKHREDLQNVSLVIWPESAAGIDPIHDPYVNNLIQEMVDTVNKPFLIGGTVWQGNPVAPNNTGILWLPFQGPTSMYVKNHLVPFGEYVPFRNTLTRYIARLDNVPEDFTPGDGGGTFTLGNLRFGDAICFEVAYDEHIRDVVHNGSQFLVAQSNNATYLGTAQPDQQFEITRFRAIEHGRAAVVATTTGKSGIISTNGTVIVASKGSGGEVLIATIPTADGKNIVDRVTPHSTEILAGFALLLLIGLRRRNLVKKVPTST